MTYDQILEAIGEKKVENMTPAERLQHYYRQCVKSHNGKAPVTETAEELIAIAV